ncbi:MAG: phosphodiester glycosidase family protein [Paludibacteraceae bacterium]
MKKLLLFTAAFILISVVSNSQTLNIDGVTYSVDTIENHQVGPGTQYVALRLQASSRLDVYFLKTDLKNEYVQIRTALGRDSIYSGERPSEVAKRKSTEGAFYFAGTNGDFYNTSGYVGYPVSGSMVDSEIAKIPGNRNTFILDDTKVPNIGKITYNGIVNFENVNWTIHTVNHLRGDDQLVLYNRHNGKFTRTNSYGTEVLIELLPNNEWSTNRTLKAKVVKIEQGVGNMIIPKGQAVLSGHGSSATLLDQLAENDEIDIRLELSVNGNNQSNFTIMSGGDNYATMLYNGVVEQTSTWDALHPRTGLGYSQNRDSLIFCVVDGRGVSVGVSTKQLAYIMKSAGAYTAFNMDGGGSSSMYVAEYGKPVNRTSDGNERAVSNSIFVVSTAPTDSEIRIIKPYESTYYLPHLGEYVPKFYAYNQYGVLVDSDLQGVVLTCPESLGVIQENKFIATGTTTGQITATYNDNVVTTINIGLLPVSGIKIRLDTVLVDKCRDYPIEVLAQTSAGDALISPAAFYWSVENPEYAEVDDGTVKALSNGVTKITGSLNDVTDDIVVKVENPDSPTLVGDSMLLTDWTLSASSFLNAQINLENRPENWQTGAVVNLVHAAGRAPFLKLFNKCTFYGLPDTVKLVMNIGDMEISRAIVSLTPNNATTVATVEFNTFENGKDFSLDIPINELFDVGDRAIYPINFDNVNFYLDAAKMIPEKTYSLAIKEITLVYKDFIFSYLATEKEKMFHVYPSLAENGKAITVRFINSFSNERLDINWYNLNGKLIKTDKQMLSGNSASVSTNGMGAGNYLLQLGLNGYTQTVKITLK